MPNRIRVNVADHAGESETWLGEFMEEAGNREDLVVATKYSLGMKSTSELVPETETKEDGEKKPYVPHNHVGNNRKSLRRSVEESLKRLRTSYIDLVRIYIRLHPSTEKTMCDRKY